MAKPRGNPFGGKRAPAFGASMSKLPTMPKAPAAAAVKKSRAPARIAKPRGSKMSRLAGIKL